MRAVRPCTITARGYGWKHAGRRKPAFSDLDFEIPAGQRVLLAGASGIGKSTLLHAIAGVLPAESGTETGTLLIDGARPSPTAGRSGLVLQDPETQSVLATVGPDAAFGPENLGVSAHEIPALTSWALDCVGLRVSEDHPTAQLSGGQKQRLALAGVLAMRPGLILLDEPTANIDPASAPKLRDAVLHAAELTGATVVVIEHRLDLWSDAVDRMIVLGADGILADGSPAAILADPAHAQALLEAGLWVPGADVPQHPVRHSSLPPLLECADLDVGRGGRTVCRGLTVAVGPGQALALTGPNGAGKSTAALTLAGLLTPAGGEVTAGRSLRELTDPVPRHSSPHRWTPRELAARIGFVFQSPELQFVRSTVRGELELSFGAGAERIDDLLERLCLSHLGQAHPKTLSGGEKRRLSAACMTSAPLMIVDEPTFGQDARSWRELAELFNAALDAGQSLITVTHDEAFIRVLGARTVAFGSSEVTR